MEVETILSSPDNYRIDYLFKSAEDTSSSFLSIVDSLTKSYVGDLDDLMKDLYQETVKCDATDAELEKYLLELGNMLYFLSSKIESVGVREDLSKLAASEAFNTYYLNSREKDVERKNKTTVAELTAIAEENSKYEKVLNLLYSRVYSQLKMKMTAGYDMVNTLRKIISKRMQEAELSFRLPQSSGLGSNGVMEV